MQSFSISISCLHEALHEALHHPGASRCKCVPIVPIKQRGFIPFLYRIMPKIGSLVAKINKHLQRDVKRWCMYGGSARSSTEALHEALREALRTEALHDGFAYDGSAYNGSAYDGSTTEALYKSFVQIFV